MIGCGPPAQQKEFDETVLSLEKRINKRQSAEIDPAELSPDELERQKRFIDLAIQSDQSIVNRLKAEGSKALRQPLVIFGEIAPNSVTEEEQKERGISSYRSHLFYVQWEEFGWDVTGIYLEIDDGMIYEFPDSIEDIKNERNPFNTSRDQLFGITRGVENSKTNTLGLSDEQWAKIIEKQLVRRIGLILKDGTKTTTAPVGYSAKFYGFL